MRCSGIWAWGKGRGKIESGRARRELGFAELKKAKFSEEQVSTTSEIKRWISPGDQSRLRHDHLQKHGGLWTDGVCCWAEKFALVPQEETLLTSRYLGLLLSCLFTPNPVHHWRTICAGINHNKSQIVESKKQEELHSNSLCFELLIFFLQGWFYSHWSWKLCYLQAKTFPNSELEKV